MEVILSKAKSEESVQKIIALFGGTFDPVHLGHTKTVQALKNDLNIDQINWVLSAQPPHKDQPTTTIQQRLEMLDLALAEYPGMSSDDIEVRRDKKSYTFDTLVEYRNLYPNANILLIVGNDIMQSFHRWHRADEILNVANLIVMNRSGYSKSINSLIRDRLTSDWQQVKTSRNGHVFEYIAPEIAISATQIRNFLRESKEVSHLLHPRVFEYISLHHLYQSEAGDSINKPLKSTTKIEDYMIDNRAHSTLGSDTILLSSQQQLDMIVEELEENKALDITILSIKEIADFADYMVIATGTSSTHLKAVSTNTIRELSRKGLRVLGEEGRDSNEWVLADFGDVVVHIMRQEIRDLYELEKLWNPELRKALAEELPLN